MSQYTFRGNLNAARFPLISTFSGRSIIIPQFDQNFQKLANFSGGDQDRDIGIPQIFYGHNIAPTAEGIQSLSYENKLAAISPAEDDFDQAFVIRDIDENKGIFVPAAGKNYIYQANNGVWQSINPLAPGTVGANTLVTVANLHGHTYHYYAELGAYEYDFNANVINPVVLNGLTPANILGLCAAVTYLIAWDKDNNVFWSSVTDATDFVPSLSTGAGSEIPNDIKGDIVVILPFPNGFMIYTTRNAVIAAYTGNIRFPWVFKEVSGSAGVEKPEYVSWEANTAFHIYWSTSGLLKLERTGTEALLPEVTDFFAARIFEDYDSGTGLLTQSFLGGDLRVKVTLLSSRYLILSYGISAGLYTHALFYDLSLKRLGKLKITHTDCFDWPEPNLFGIQTYDDLIGKSYDSLIGTSYNALSEQQITFSKPKRNIAFLQQDGSVKVLNFDLGDLTDDAVVFFGKFQMVRFKNITILNATFENVGLTAAFTLAYLTTYDGKNFARTMVPPIVRRTENVIEFGGRQTGENHTLRAAGSFNFNTMLLTVMSHGDR